MADFLSMGGPADELGVPLNTLQNNVDTATGLIRLDNTPPLRTLLLGRRRMIARAEIESWLRALGTLPASEPTAPAEPTAEVQRPRRTAVVGTGQ